MMKAKEVLYLLKITRQTLSKYVHDGVIEVTRLPNGKYEYHADSVYHFLNKEMKKDTYIYANVSSKQQKDELEKQIALLKEFCADQGYPVSKIFSDMSDNFSLNSRKSFYQMLDAVIQDKVCRVVILNKTILSNSEFDLFLYLFRTYHCEIIVAESLMSDEV